MLREFDSHLSIFSMSHGLYFLPITCTLFAERKPGEIMMKANWETGKEKTDKRKMRLKCLSKANPEKWVHMTSLRTEMVAEWMWKWSGGCDWLRQDNRVLIGWSCMSAVNCSFVLLANVLWSASHQILLHTTGSILGLMWLFFHFPAYWMIEQD